MADCCWTNHDKHTEKCDPALNWVNILSPAHFSLGGCSEGSWDGDTIEMYGYNVEATDLITPDWSFTATMLRATVTFSTVTTPGNLSFVGNIGSSPVYIDSPGTYTITAPISGDNLSFTVSFENYDGVPWTVDSVEAGSGSS